MNFKTVLLIILPCALFARPIQDKSQYQEKERQLAALKTKLQETRDSLQQEIAERWRARQRAVEVREIDKEEIGRLTDAQEKVLNQLSIVKEEVYARERQLEDALRVKEQKEQEWAYVKTMLRDILEKEADKISDAFPSEMEHNRQTLEKIRRTFDKEHNVVATVSSWSDYALLSVKNGNRLSVTKQTMLPENGAPQHLILVRFGNVFAYGINESGTVYHLHQNGRGGAERYTLKAVENPEFLNSLEGRLNVWVSTGIPQGVVPVDILQNEHSNMLTTGRSETLLIRVKRFVKAGGPVMIPLILLPIWALILVLLKLAQFAGKRSSYRRLFCEIDRILNGQDAEGVRAFLQKKKGIAARVSMACLKKNIEGRKGAEAAMKEELMRSVPAFGSHLNTLAVIAAVAPLLGLLGTVTGMISLFEVITRFGTGDPKILAGGISEALITTEVGLIIAIPVLLVHNFLRNKKNRITAELQVLSLSLLNRIYPEA